MSEERQGSPASAITDDVVANLGRMVGLQFPPERLPAIAERLREMHALAAVLDAVELTDVAPASRFDPTWPEGSDR